MGAKIMSQGVGGLRGILLIMGKEKEMEGSGLGETRLLSVLVSTNVCSDSVWYYVRVCAFVAGGSKASGVTMCVEI